MEIRLSKGSNVPYQSNNWDCGIFTIGFAEYILKEIVNEL
jgi:Ulp1 family protease